MTPKKTLSFLEHAIRNKFPVLLKGAPGIGKTDLVKQASEATKADLIISHPVVADPTDYKGLPFVVEGGAEFLPFGELQKLIEANKPTVFFLDDLGQASVAVQAAAMQLILERRINGHRVSDQVIFIAATNRRQDKAGVSGLLEPVKSRFASIIEIEVSVDDWVEWALNNDVPSEILSFIRYRPELLHKFETTKDLVNTPSPRTITHVARMINSKLSRDIEYEVISGAAGEGFASEFLAFLKIFRNLPDPDKIITNPDKVEVPEDPATLYALMGALVQRVNEKTVDNVISYLDRCPVEYSVVAVKDMITKHPELTQTKAYIDWAVKNQESII